MTELEEDKSKISEVAKSSFLEALGLIPTPEAQSFRDLIEADLIRITTDEDAISAFRKNRKSGGIGFSVSFDPATRSAKAIVAIDSNWAASRGPRSLGGSIRNMLEKFEVCRRIVKEQYLNWQALADSEVETFISEMSSGGGKDYRTFSMNY